ncbi:MAG: DUF2891 domain-containing protein, partial [Nonlabens sp.]
MKYLIYALVAITVISCKNFETSATDDKIAETPNVEIADKIPTPQLTLKQANNLAQLPLHCIETEYPNKMGHVTASPTDQKRPTVQHPVFYGCFDWHSAVHGYWSAVTLLKNFPELEQREELLLKIHNNLTIENIAVEVAYFNTANNTSFERTYGWAWLLKLQQELDSWDSVEGEKFSEILQPLTDVIVTRYMEYLPKLNYAIRVGEHSNTAFGMAFAHDYAVHSQNSAFKNNIESRARDFYLKDTDCPISWEPSGYDFLSPCLEEVDIMRRILPEMAFHKWIKE